jgi:hypothetical protein
MAVAELAKKSAEVRARKVARNLRIYPFYARVTLGLHFP